MNRSRRSQLEQALISRRKSGILRKSEVSAMMIDDDDDDDDDDDCTQDASKRTLTTRLSKKR